MARLLDRMFERVIHSVSKAARLPRVVKVTGKTVGAMLGLASATALVAQTVPDQSVPNTGGLNLPSNPTIYGKIDPNIRRPTAIVNGTVLTGTDVDQRMALIVAANDIRLTPEDREQLRQQVIQSLIDEILQIQEAKAHEVTVTDAEITQAYNNLSRNFNRSPAELRVYLRQIGSSERTLRHQIEAQLAWTRLLRRRVEPFVNVGDEEVNAVLDRLKAARGTDEYHLKEIFLRSTPDNAAQVSATLSKMIDEMKTGQHPFEYFAQFSDATSKAQQGDLDWLNAAQLSQLPESMQGAVQQMQVGQIAGPIEVPGGYSLLYLVDKRKVLTADPRDAKLSLRQLTIKFPAGTTQEQATARASLFAQKTKDIRGCGDATKVAAQIGADVVDNDNIRVRDLPTALQRIVLDLQIGQATPPFGSVTEGVRTLVICSREDPPAQGQLPDPSAVQSQIEQQRVNLRAQTMLRDLRREAIIEYR